jgi:hypothetical protein
VHILSQNISVGVWWRFLVPSWSRGSYEFTNLIISCLGLDTEPIIWLSRSLYRTWIHSQGSLRKCPLIFPWVFKGAVRTPSVVSGHGHRLQTLIWNRGATATWPETGLRWSERTAILPIPNPQGAGVVTMPWNFRFHRPTPCGEFQLISTKKPRMLPPFWGVRFHTCAQSLTTRPSGKNSIQFKVKRAKGVCWWSGCQMGLNNRSGYVMDTWSPLVTGDATRDAFHSYVYMPAAPYLDNVDLPTISPYPTVPWNHQQQTPYLGNVDLPTMSPYPASVWNYQQLPVVDGDNYYSNSYPIHSPSLPGTPSRLPPTPNSPPSSLPSSPRLRIDASLMHGYYDASNEHHMLSDRSLLNAAVDQYTSSLVLVLPQDLDASYITVTPTTSSPYVTAFDVVAAIQKALYMPSQWWGEPSHRRLDFLRGSTRISVRGRHWAGYRPVLYVKFS